MENPMLIEEEDTRDILVEMLRQAPFKAIPARILVGLVYLADRWSTQVTSHPMMEDEIRICLPSGPVHKALYDILVKGADMPESWEGWVERRGDNLIAAGTTPPDQLPGLSQADCKVIALVWKEYGHLSEYGLIDAMTNGKTCTEWQPCSQAVEISL